MPDTADVTYIEALTLEEMTKIIEKERPDALLPNLGGQTGLNLSSELAGAGVLDRYGVKVIGVQIDAIKRGEDRQAFKDTMEKLGIEMCRGEIANSLEEAEDCLAKIGLPCVIRPAYTMGGTGGGFALDSGFNPAINKAIRVARTQLAPQLLNLPLPLHP